MDIIHIHHAQWHMNKYPQYPHIHIRIREYPN